MLSNGRGGCCPMGGVDVCPMREVDIVQWDGWILSNGRGGSCPTVGVDLVQ